VKVLFVCSGNTCRSPYAEAVARSLGLEARSAGCDAWPDQPATRDARKSADTRGVNLAPHRSSSLADEHVEWADVIVCFDDPHLAAVERLGGGAKARLVPVADPWLTGDYERAYDEIDVAVRTLA
jgi:protein-tyrosine phosphatase